MNTSGKFEIEYRPFATIKFFEQITDLVCIEATNKKIELISQINYNIPQVMISAPSRIQQILVNLIKNAVKFTKEGHVKFIVDFNSENQTLLFKVEDTGIGIPKEKQDKIFGEYYQVDKSTTRTYGGTGLGLSISKKLTELLNGTIKVETNAFNGTTFSVEIPYQLPEQSVLSEIQQLYSKKLKHNVLSLLPPEMQQPLDTARLFPKPQQRLLSFLLNRKNTSHQSVRPHMSAPHPQ